MINVTRVSALSIHQNHKHKNPKTYIMADITKSIVLIFSCVAAASTIALTTEAQMSASRTC